ncbi:aminotransferase class V-fold PLP-dependent enzyme [Candidatus Pelagibacter sp.]|nr:aminotransferase class V-fold PLP-dependent enzyme [Candidatus Pelagibacter sp.]|tara:strand:- start:782 stop:1969 length:1188 start_codon:yes stop_codon:yes gene_type:complete
MYRDFKYKLAEDTITKLEISKLALWLKKAKRLTQGRTVENFQNNFSKYLDVKNSIFVNSGSSANLLIAQSLLESGMLKNKVVIAPTVSWSTTVSPFLQLGYDVKLCDTNLKNLGLDIEHLERLCKKFKPSLIILVHVLGHANDMENISKICKKYKVLLIEDTCEALGSEIKKKKLGTFGIASSFSFYYGHHISTIEGGMVCTKNNYLANIMKSVRSHGWLRDFPQNEKNKILKKNKISKFQSKFSFIYSGFNIRSTELNAHLGIGQLKKINKISKIRHKNYKIFKKYLNKFHYQNCKTEILSNFGFATLVLNRDEVFEHLTKKKIECRPIIAGNISNQPFWKKLTKNKKFPHANLIHYYGIYLPNHPKLKKKDIIFICEEFSKKAKILRKISVLR